MKTYKVCMLEYKDNLVYTGVTNDKARRFDEHQLGINKIGFTYKRRPVRLIGHETFNEMEQRLP
ncbi:GIY-YIG nuclease family protein [Maribacter polysaccharolyticus]|uniref:GIY-YIG nuclease family protein n=1 Tax=Maribacter polysaccharolyticus TaxID=3020831 RepID=UPI00237F79F4|nr:GIY-YIG nuclease family protein [Maribacter polysaccharolyticus]MDE3742874.1 hypothetical protein [Maribacter polysaccharolyticus]